MDVSSISQNTQSIHSLFENSSSRGASSFNSNHCWLPSHGVWRVSFMSWSQQSFHARLLGVLSKVFWSCLSAGYPSSITRYNILETALTIHHCCLVPFYFFSSPRPFHFAPCFLSSPPLNFSSANLHSRQIISTTLSLRSLHHFGIFPVPTVGQSLQCVVLGDGPWEHVGQRNVVWRHIVNVWHWDSGLLLGKYSDQLAGLRLNWKGNGGSI